MIQSLDSTTHTTMELYKEPSIDLKENITDVNKSKQSIGTISRQLQVRGSTAQTTVSIKFMAQLCHCHDEEENTIYNLLRHVRNHIKLELWKSLELKTAMIYMFFTSECKLLTTTV